MSMIRCDRCAWNIDSDGDPSCFVENPGLPGTLGDEVLCERCRDKAEAEREAAQAAANKCIAEMEKCL